MGSEPAGLAATLLIVPVDCVANASMQLSRLRVDLLRANPGETPHTLTLSDVPVHGFWSVTLYDDKGYIPVNKYNAYAFNNLTAKKDEDGSVTIHFGGDPEADNFLPIIPGWNILGRMYKPGQEILDGRWQFPTPSVV